MPRRDAAGTRPAYPKRRGPAGWRGLVSTRGRIRTCDFWLRRATGRGGTAWSAVKKCPHRTGFSLAAGEADNPGSLADVPTWFPRSTGTVGCSGRRGITVRGAAATPLAVDCGGGCGPIPVHLGRQRGGLGDVCPTPHANPIAARGGGGRPQCQSASARRALRRSQATSRVAAGDLGLHERDALSGRMS